VIVQPADRSSQDGLLVEDGDDDVDARRRRGRGRASWW
jgi:hypothetical protein